ncbi:MAG: pilus assembly protein PilM [Kiritimatiellia bacterium]
MARTKQIIALDAGSHTLQALWLQMRGSKPVVTRAESFAMPLDTENPNELAEQWISKKGLAKAFCQMGLHGTRTVFQSGKITYNDPRTAEQIAEMDIAQFNEMAGDEMEHDVIDFELDNEPGMRRYLMAMARPAEIEKAVRETTRMHVRPADLTPTPVALYNALESFTPEHAEPWCFVNIGDKQTDIAIGTKAGLLFARTISVGGRIFTDAVAAETGMPKSQAEVRKQADCGLRQTDACYESLRKATDRWLAQLNACLGVYRSQFPEQKLARIPRIVFSGGGARLKGFKQYLSSKLAIQVLDSSELPNIPDSYKKYVGLYDIAYGLALSATKNAISRLSLLPEDLKNEVIFKARKPWWIATALLMFIAMGVYSVTGVYMLRRDGRMLSEEQIRLRQRETIDKRIEHLKTLETQLLTNSVSLARLLMNGPVAREVLSLVCSSVDPDDWITLFCDEKIYNPEEQTEPEKLPENSDAPRNPFSLFRTMRKTRSAAASEKNDKPAERKEMVEHIDSVFIVEGYTPDPSLKTVREMIQRLTTSPEIARVDLRSDDQVLAPAGVPELEDENIPDFRRFVIEIEVQRQ